MHQIYLLGADRVEDEEEKLVETPTQREALTKQIPASVAAKYRYWLPHRKEIFEQMVMSTYHRE